MKKFLLLILTFSIFSLNGFAQNNIQLNIHHKLSDTDFEMNNAAKNNLDNDFKVTRLQYYISEISIVHDGGTETQIEDTWFLVNSSQVAEVDLGSHDITEVEAINFHIGVDPDHNHLDPSSYQGSHPLAPQNPSMHWGWAAGYRILAMEGKGGSNYDQTFELHGLGDDNYFKTEISLTASAENNELFINLDADYTRVLEDITVSTGVIVHGDYGEAKTAIENFRDYVAKLSNTEMYRDQFTRTFGSDEITSFKMSLAMEQFMMSIVSSDSKYDKYLAGDVQLTDSEERGRVLFEAEYNPFFPDQSGADCAHCHGGANFENDEYRNNGLDAEADITDIGREEVTQDPNDRAKNSKSLHLEISK